MRIVNCEYADLETKAIQIQDADLFSIPFIETDRAKPTETSTPPALDTDLLNLSVSSWLEKLSDDERDNYQERAAIMEYDGGLPREQAEVEAIKRIIQERIIRGKCDKCERVNGCMMTPGQRALCEVNKPCPKEINK